jgi:hypothetical protein
MESWIRPPSSSAEACSSKRRSKAGQAVADGIAAGTLFVFFGYCIATVGLDLPCP